MTCVIRTAKRLFRLASPPASSSLAASFQEFSPVSIYLGRFQISITFGFFFFFSIVTFPPSSAPDLPVDQSQCGPQGICVLQSFFTFCGWSFVSHLFSILGVSLEPILRGFFFCMAALSHTFVLTVRPPEIFLGPLVLCPRKFRQASSVPSLTSYQLLSQI